MKNKNFLDHVNDKQTTSEEKESFQKEDFVHVKREVKFSKIIILLLIPVLIIIFMFYNQNVEVIDLNGLTLEEAFLWADSQNIMLSNVEVYSELDEGRVSSQSIEVGQKIKKNSFVKLEISKGLDPYELIVLADFDESWSKNSIQNWLEENGVLNYNFVTEVNEIIEEDFLIRYRLIGATIDNFTRSSEIEFTLTQVIDTSSVEIPSFMNGSLTAVDTWAQSENIEYSYIVESNILYAENKVFYQSVLPGQNMSRTDVLELKVSDGVDYESVEMINLINMSLSSGESWFKNNRIDYEKQYVFSNFYPENIIMDQSIYEGVIIGGEKITIKVSLGEGLEVDNYSSLSLNEALFISNQYNNIDVVEYYSDLEKGDFISQSISSGKYINSDDFLEVRYSKGTYVQVPDFRNQTVYDLESWINDQNDSGANLTFEIIVVENNNLDSGLIIRQDVINGQLAVDGNINVDVSSGLSIPDFSEMTKEDAINFSNQSMINVNMNEAYSMTTLKDDLISQSIEPGVKGDQHTVIEVVYSKGTELAIPNFTGMVITDVDSWIREENKMGASLSLEVHEQFSSTVDYGDIISQNIYNVYEAINTDIKIIVSNGVSYTVPNWQYNTMENIESNAIANHVNVVFEIVADSSVASGRVISQSPDPGTVISKQDFITIKISE